MTNPDFRRFNRSTHWERVVEHLFQGAVLRHFWVTSPVREVDVLKPEVDEKGYDIVISCGRIVRHIQVKTSISSGKARSQNIHANRSDGRPRPVEGPQGISQRSGTGIR